MKKFRQILATTVVIGGTIASFVFFEAIIVGLAAFAGFWGASLILSAIFIILSLGAIFLYDYGQREQEYHLVTRIRNWLAKQEQNIKPWTRKLIKKSQPLGFLVSTEFFGPLITTIIIKATTDTEKKRLQRRAILSSFIFGFTWVAIYSGAIYGIRKLF